MARNALILCAALVMLAACGGAKEETTAAGFYQNRLQPAASSSSTLLYVSDWNEGEIFILTYPDRELVATIADDQFPLGLCSDANGNVWVTNYGAGSNQIVEYAHGGTAPIATLDDPNEAPRGCAVNPLTGDLAVANGYPGNVVIYLHASGSPQSYATGLAFPFACAYDEKGDLFVDGYRLRDGDKFALSELPSGASAFQKVKIGGTLGLPGNIQWDGTYLAVGGYPSSSTIYRLQIFTRAMRVKLESTVALAGPAVNPPHGVQFWLQDGTLIMPFGTKRSVESVGLWNYPAGGKRTGALSGFGGDELYGVTVSVPPSFR